MKKFLLGFVALFCLLFGFMSFALEQTDSFDSQERKYIAFNDNEGYIPLEDYKEKTRVMADYLNVSYDRYSRIVIPRTDLDFNSDKLILGLVYQKGTVVDNWTVPFNLRIYAKDGQRITVEKLDETYTVMPFLPQVMFDSFDNLHFIISRKALLSTDYDYEYSTEAGKFIFNVRFQNSSGKLLNGEKQLVTLEYGRTMPGIFIPTAFCLKEENTYYVYKVVTLNRKTYYKKIEVKLLKTFEGFCQIAGPLNADNIIVRF